MRTSETGDTHFFIIQFFFLKIHAAMASNDQLLVN